MLAFPLEVTCKWHAYWRIHLPFPSVLINDHCSYSRITAQEEEDLLFALQHRDRLRVIRLEMQTPDLKRLIVAMSGEFPMLECLMIVPPISSTFPTTSFILPATFHAPRLRRLKLSNSASPIVPPSLTSLTGLVKLSLVWDHPPTYPCPGTLLQRLSSVPSLEMLQISFYSSVYNEEVERQLPHALTMTHVIFPNLRRFTFDGDRDYLEAFLTWIITPLLEKLHIAFFYQHNDHTFPVPHLVKFLGTIESLGFANVKLKICPWYILVQVYHRRSVGGDFSLLHYDSGTFSQKMSTAGGIVNSLGTLFSTVEHLTLQRETASVSMGIGMEHSLTQWCKLLWPFGNVKTLLVDDGWTGEMSRFLPFGPRGPPMELLPELEELVYCTHQDIVVKAFTKFTKACRKAGRPVTLVRHQTSCGW